MSNYNHDPYRKLFDDLGIPPFSGGIMKTSNPKAEIVNFLPKEEVINNIYQEGEDIDRVSLKEAIRREHQIQALKDRKKQFTDVVAKLSYLIVDAYNLSTISSIINQEINLINSEIGGLV